MQTRQTRQLHEKKYGCPTGDGIISATSPPSSPEAHEIHQQKRQRLQLEEPRRSKTPTPATGVPSSSVPFDDESQLDDQDMEEDMIANTIASPSISEPGHSPTLDLTTYDLNDDHPFLETFPKRDAIRIPALSESSLVQHTDYVEPHHPKPVTTLFSAKRRLRIDPNEFIEQRPICNDCFKHYSHSVIADMASPKCTEPLCKGSVYEIKITSKDGIDTEWRVPLKIYPYCSPTATIKRYMTRPGFTALLRDSRADADRPPLAPDERMHDIYDGSHWRSQEVGLQRKYEDGKVVDSEVFPGSRRKLVSYRYGLQFVVNLDWFGTQEGRLHSCGMIYLCLLNLARSVRYKPRYIFVVGAIPGPFEPSLLQLNHILKPMTDEFIELQKGMYMWVHGHDIPQMVPAVIAFESCDTPASRKIAGQAGHSHHTLPCPVCDMPLASLTDLANFDKDPPWKAREPQTLMNAAFEYLSASSKRKEILKDFGVRPTELNNMATWWAWRNTPIDLMHNGFLRMVSNEFEVILVNGIMLSKEQWRSFDKLVKSISFLSHAGRPPTSMGTNPALKKADELRTWSIIAPVVLYAIWKDETDTLPTHAKPIPPNTKNRPAWDRNP
ncbi:hypothetical protein FRB93_012274 [Tulasnella sp. JGI-2019a]|nr:hypothetical protein FRB93_012274 [Tulasnella sp. JGI-2019a]